MVLVILAISASSDGPIVIHSSDVDIWSGFFGWDVEVFEAGDNAYAAVDVDISAVEVATIFLFVGE